MSVPESPRSRSRTFNSSIDEGGLKRIPETTSA
jgi:hypothetical protein